MAGFYWQLFTSMFVHFGFTHIIFNMFALYYFGRLNETTFTAPKFLTIYFASGLLGSVMTLVLLAHGNAFGRGFRRDLRSRRLLCGRSKEGTAHGIRFGIRRVTLRSK